MLANPRFRTVAAAAAVIAVLAVVIISGWPPSPRPPGAGTATAGAASATPVPTPRPTATPTPSPTLPLATRPGATVPASTPTVPPTVVLAGAGDIADCRSDGDTQTAAILRDLQGATVFTLGDNAYEDGSRREFDDCYGPTWGRFLDRTRPAPGNHDYNTPDAAGYFSYFGDRAGPGSRGYYAYTLGAWRIYSLNSNCEDVRCDEGSPQLAWLRNDLSSEAGRCALAYWHHPRFSSGDHGSQEAMAPIWDALHAAGVEIVLAGHDHSYERFEPLDGAGRVDPDGGVTSFVVGTGGRRFYDFGQVLPGSAARNTGTWGVLELTLAPDSWSSRFIPVAGQGYTDTASGTCH